MRDHSGTILSFIASHEAWYAPVNNIRIPEITITLRYPDGVVSGEFVIQWVYLGRQLSPQLQAFDDSWSALAEINRRTDGKFLSGLEDFDSTDPSPEIVIAWLISLGFTDDTKRER